MCRPTAVQKAHRDTRRKEAPTEAKDNNIVFFVSFVSFYVCPPTQQLRPTTTYVDRRRLLIVAISFKHLLETALT